VGKGVRRKGKKKGTKWRDRGVGELAADEALGGEDGVLRVGHGLALGRLADQDVAVLGEGDDGGRRAPALAVGDDDVFRAVANGHARVGRAEVDAENLSHGGSGSWVGLWFALLGAGRVPRGDPGKVPVLSINRGRIPPPGVGQGRRTGQVGTGPVTGSPARGAQGHGGTGAREYSSLAL